MNRKKRIWLISLTLAGILYYISLPDRLFNDPYSAVLEDYEGKLLAASIAADGQWRFPQANSVPDKFTESLVLFEDKRFYYHPGVDVLSLARAAKQNIQAGKVVSGGSTISMQTIRLSRQGKPRTYFEKLIEIILATRLELRYSKDEILALYASHAPFGGNVVGLEAACWRYFGRQPQDVSWAEAALLAVLPNAPSLIHPGKNRETLKSKRDRLLERLRDKGAIDSIDCILAQAEPIPEQPLPLPQHARHLLARAINEGHGQQRVRSTLHLPLQNSVERIIDDHHRQLKGNHVFNAAAIVLDVESGNALAYVGNTSITESNIHGDEVDIITSPRSTGSILKPFLYAAMLDEGKMLPKTLWPDVPVFINGFAPRNFSRDYDGAVPADKALIRSLNVPAVYMLQEYRHEKFHSLLTNIGMTTLRHPPDHYGLALILGGAEGTLWDIAGMYASMARTLNHYFNYPGARRYNRQDYHPPVYMMSEKREEKHIEENSWLSAAAIYQTFETLTEVYRPGEETGWRYFDSSKKIAWKTGTSFGFRDAWAIGVTPQYVVGVWIGNADGEGRPRLTGTEAAAPAMFNIFSLLPAQEWFQPPLPEMEYAAVCSKSGHRVAEHCSNSDSVLIARSGLASEACPYHKMVHLSKNGRYRVHSGCEAISNMQATSWFILPPTQEYYFRSKNISYKPLPPFRGNCQPIAASASMDLVYPKSDAKIFIPRELDGQTGHAVFELAHRDPVATVYWHLDGAYIGLTRGNHRLPFQPMTGKHLLTLVDESGETLERSFEVVLKMQ